MTERSQVDDYDDDDFELWHTFALFLSRRDQSIGKVCLIFHTIFHFSHYPKYHGAMASTLVKKMRMTTKKMMMNATKMMTTMVAMTKSYLEVAQLVKTLQGLITKSTLFA